MFSMLDVPLVVEYVVFWYTGLHLLCSFGMEMLLWRLCFRVLAM